MTRISMNVCIKFVTFSEFTYEGIINIFPYSIKIISLNQTLYKLQGRLSVTV